MYYIIRVITWYTMDGEHSSEHQVYSSQRKAVIDRIWNNPDHYLPTDMAWEDDEEGVGVHYYRKESK